MKTNVISFAIAVIVLASCQQPAPTNNTEVKEVDTTESREGMVKVTILYPNSEGSTFNMEYYKNNHMPMVARLLGDALKWFEIDEGVSGRTPDEPIPYLAIGYLYFDKLSDYQESFGPNAEQIVGDIPNYTNTQPVVQISEIVK